MAAEFPDHPFWDFSLRVYGSEGVPEACLVLQERYGIDVNVLLYCCWLGASGRGTLDDGEIAAVRGAVEHWHRDVVRAVRAVRQRLKGGFGGAPVDLSEPIRRRIAKIEVDLEHVEQLMLAGSVVRDADDESRRRRAAGPCPRQCRRLFPGRGNRPRCRRRLADRDHRRPRVRRPRFRRRRRRRPGAARVLIVPASRESRLHPPPGGVS